MQTNAAKLPQVAKLQSNLLSARTSCKDKHNGSTLNAGYCCRNKVSHVINYVTYILYNTKCCKTNILVAAYSQTAHISNTGDSMQPLYFL